MISSPTRGHGLLEGLLANWRARVADRLIPAGHRSGRLLDIGCGAYSVFLLKTRCAEKVGLEKQAFVPETLPASVKLRILQHDLEAPERFPFDSSSFDLMTMLAVFEHIEPARLGHVLSEVFRLLKPGGIFIMTTPASWTDRLLKAMARLRLVSDEEIREHKGAYTHPQIASRLERAGFSKGNLKAGYFQGLMNLWVTATK